MSFTRDSCVLVAVHVTLAPVRMYTHYTHPFYIHITHTHSTYTLHTPILHTHTHSTYTHTHIPLVSGTISKLSDSAHRMKTGHPTATSSSSSVPVAMVTIGDREVAAGIISQRRVDKDNDCDTENYSGIRIK